MMPPVWHTQLPQRSRQHQSLTEFTLKAIVLGSIFGLIFGASTVYLA
jgi:uncharacterized oligopeptide transporter (OPT) family protein